MLWKWKCSDRTKLMGIQMQVNKWYSACQEFPNGKTGKKLCCTERPPRRDVTSGQSQFLGKRHTLQSESPKSLDISSAPLFSSLPHACSAALVLSHLFILCSHFCQDKRTSEIPPPWCFGGSAISGDETAGRRHGLLSRKVERKVKQIGSFKFIFFPL